MNQASSNTASNNKGRKPLVASNSRTEEITIDQHTMRVTVIATDPQIVYITNFLTHEECKDIVNLAQPRLLTSTVVNTVTGAMEQHTARSSQGTYFARGQTATISQIEQRIAAITNWPVDHGEGLQVLNYQINGEYRRHFDYFDPALPGSNIHLARGGQRFATMIMYLNTPTAGGTTDFPRLDISVPAIQGAAVFFANVDDNLTVGPRSEHAGMPVLAGEKWIATKWLRANKFG